jgi:hypothetical protein
MVCEPANNTLSVGENDGDGNLDGAPRTYRILSMIIWKYLCLRRLNLGLVATPKRIGAPAQWRRERGDSERWNANREDCSL